MFVQLCFQLLVTANGVEITHPFGLVPLFLLD